MGWDCSDFLKQALLNFEKYAWNKWLDILPPPPPKTQKLKKHYYFLLENDV